MGVAVLFLCNRKFLGIPYDTKRYILCFADNLRL